MTTNDDIWRNNAQIVCTGDKAFWENLANEIGKRQNLDSDSIFAGFESVMRERATSPTISGMVQIRD